jgi:hypothetical protein
MSQGNPTDDALATIASILDKMESQREPAKPAVEAVTTPVEADGYTKIGPGPMAAIRFKWSVRPAENGDNLSTRPSATVWRPLPQARC